MAGYHTPTHKNPATADGIDVTRGGGQLARPWLPFDFVDGWHTEAGSAPTEFRQCVIPGSFPNAEFLIVPPDGVQLVVVAGRWISVRKPVDVEVWVDEEEHIVQGLTIIQVKANTDPCAIYISAILEGDASSGIKLAWRPSP